MSDLPDRLEANAFNMMQRHELVSPYATSLKEAANRIRELEAALLASVSQNTASIKRIEELEARNEALDKEIDLLKSLLEEVGAENADLKADRDTWLSLQQGGQ